MGYVAIDLVVLQVRVHEIASFPSKTPVLLLYHWQSGLLPEIVSSQRLLDTHFSLSLPAVKELAFKSFLAWDKCQERGLEPASSLVRGICGIGLFYGL